MTRKGLVKSYLKSGAYKLGCVLISDERFTRWQHKRDTGRTLDLTNPVTFNEKIQWIKLNCRDERYRECVDRYDVRDYVRHAVGDHVLNDLYGVYTSVDQIDFSSLPYPCVLKLTHGSGQNVFLRHKEDVNSTRLRRLLRYYLWTNHFIVAREWAYKHVSPRIICELHLFEEGGLPKDYKVFCFNGDPKVIQVNYDYSRGHERNMIERNMYDTDWNLLPWVWAPRGTPENKEARKEDVEHPTQLATMLDYSRQLARGFPFVRVDWYHIDDKIVFGEMTFYPDKGTGVFEPESYDAVVGSYLELPDNRTAAART
jgi:TupA-like ATPgrasp